jgi:N-acetyl-gamma-glutamyl-phosphate reductase
MRSYLVNEHRHTPEILATSGLKEEQLNFAPTVGPFLRGIFANAFIKTSADPDVSIFKNHPFVRLVDKVEMTNVVSTNFIDLHYAQGNGGEVIAQGALDNLLRGASGTAVQNMNIMFGLDETEGLNFNTAIYP